MTARATRYPAQLAVLLPATVAAVLATGCASVPTTVDPADYRKIGNKTVRVQTVQDEKFEAIGVWCSDSTMILDRALYPGYDRHEYPRTIQLKDVQSVATLQQESLIYIESGVEMGVNYGVESTYFAKTIMATEIGYLSGERPSRPRPTFGFGATFYFMGSFEDLAQSPLISPICPTIALLPIASATRSISWMEPSPRDSNFPRERTS
ncbi:MAG: hypothetical protein OEX18_13440 [Candidatus Krumholzibacteria bacterium]|nr:hypothetical protein [Candidatus Krumholzibacteria bacterium]